MHATVRRLKTKRGKVDEVADLIETEYIPKLSDLNGVVSYTLVYIGEDEVASLAIFENDTAAIAANGLAQMFVNERLSRLLASQLEVIEGDILIHAGLLS
jgi:hypothetical protein